MQCTSIQWRASAAAFLSLVVVLVLSPANAQPTQPATRPTVPIVYAPLASPERLTAAQELELWSYVKLADLGNREAWFVRVLYNQNNSFRADVFFRPDSTQDRLSRGVYLRIDNEWSIDDRRRIGEQLGEPWHGPLVRSYAHVAAVGERVSATDAPALKSQPFRLPEGVEERDLIALVDLARAAVRADESGQHRDLPISKISPVEKGKLRVYFGWQVGPLHGQGCYVDVAHTAQGYKASQVGSWFS